MLEGRLKALTSIPIIEETYTPKYTARSRSPNIISMIEESYITLIHGAPLSVEQILHFIVDELVKDRRDILIVDLHGNLAKLYYIYDNIKILVAGDTFYMNIFNPEAVSQEQYIYYLSTILQITLDLEESYMAILEEGIERSLKHKSINPIKDILNNIAYISTLSPRDYHKYDTVRRRIWWLLRGYNAAIISRDIPVKLEQLLKGTTIIDMSNLIPPLKTLLTLTLLLKLSFKAENSNHHEPIIIVHAADDIVAKRDIQARIIAEILQLAREKYNLVITSYVISKVNAFIKGLVDLIITTRDTFDDIRYHIDIDETEHSAILWFRGVKLSVNIEVDVDRIRYLRKPTPDECYKRLKILGYNIPRLKPVIVSSETMLEADFKSDAKIAYTILTILKETYASRGEIVKILNERDILPEKTATILDLLTILGYIQEFTISGRRLVKITKKGEYAHNEYSMKAREVNFNG